MTADTTLRIWTPLNTVAILCVPPNATATNTLQQLLATSDVAALVLGDLPAEYGWELYVNSPLSDDIRTATNTADCGACSRLPHAGEPADATNQLAHVDPDLNILSVISKLPTAIASRAQLRLACAHPSLTFQVTLANVPHIDDGRTLFWGISHFSTVTDVLDGLTELYQLPLISMEYIVETVEVTGNHQGMRINRVRSCVIDTSCSTSAT
jgi:hypothetical protein